MFWLECLTYLLQTFRQWRLEVALDYFFFCIWPLWSVNNTCTLIQPIKTFSLTLKKYQATLIGETFLWINNMILYSYWCIALCSFNRLKSRKNRNNFSSHSVLRWTCFLNNTANIESFLSCWMLTSMDQLVLLSWDHCLK